MEELLIEQVRLHDVLYNVQSPNYRNQNIRQEAWEEIGRKLQIKAETAKNKWDKLRRCFLNAINRRRSKRSSQPFKKITPWKYELQMSFILPFVDSRKIHSNIEDQGLNSHYDDLDGDQVLTKDCERGEDQKQSILDHQDDDALDKTIKDPPNLLSFISRQSRDSRNDNPLAEMLKVMTDNSLKESKYEDRQGEELDVTDMFFMSMSKMTKTLPTLEQAKIKLVLSNAVLQAQIRVHDDQNLLDRPSSGAFISPGSTEFSLNVLSQVQADRTFPVKKETDEPPSLDIAGFHSDQS